MGHVNGLSTHPGKEWRNKQDRFVPTPSPLKATVATSPSKEAADEMAPSLTLTPQPSLPAPSAVASAPEVQVRSPVPKPAVAPQAALSKDAIDKRLRRIFQPRSDGTYQVSEDFVKQFQAKGASREALLVMFEKCDYEPDRVIYNLGLFSGCPLQIFNWEIRYVISF